MLKQKIFCSKTELALLFLKLGVTGFGGPIAHIAMMREEIVVKRTWLSDLEFMDLVSATNLIPGPNSTELAIHIGHKVHGLRGLIIAGSCFIFPAFIIVLTISVLYSNFGKLPQVASIMLGMKPIIISIILLALIGFRKSALTRSSQYLSFLFSMLLIWFGVNELLILFLSGLMAIRHFKLTSISPLLMFVPSLIKTVSSQSIFFYFLKIGSVLFGSGYVLFAFIKKELVDEKMWLSMQQLMDAITVGQLTPGPVFTSATFVGYLLNGYEGAVVATVGIFLPAFLFVIISIPILKTFRKNQTFSEILDGINAASFALLLSVTYELGIKSLFSFSTILLFLLSFFILKYSKLNSSWMVFIGGFVGYYFL